MILGASHAAYPIGDASRVGEARRHAAVLAQDCGFDDVAAGRLALVVTELANNLLRHAKHGRLWLRADVARNEVEVIAVDDGPGIPDLDRSLHDGFSTGGTPGTGLGAVRRLAQQFDVHSSVPGGTVIVARLRAERAPPPASTAVCSGAVALMARGERVCGDAWGVALDGDRAALLVADGLGHGPDAAEASSAALAAFAEEPFMDLRLLLQHLHARLRSTRGAALMVMHADAAEGTIRSIGAGNVLGRVVSGVSDRTILTQHGTAGITIRTPEEVTTAWPPHALLVACSDGIETRWMPELLVPVLGRDPALAAALLARDHCRGRDDATVAVLRRKD